MRAAVARSRVNPESARAEVVDVVERSPESEDPAVRVQANALATLDSTMALAASVARHAAGRAGPGEGPPPTDEELRRAVAASKVAEPVMKPLIEATIVKKLMEAGNEKIIVQGPPRGVEDAMLRLGMTGGSWRAWRTVARLLDDAELDDEDVETIKARADCDPPSSRVRQLWAVVGRRGGKSTMAAVVAVAQACRPYPRVINPVVGLIAKSQEQAKNVAAYVADYADRLGVLVGKAGATQIKIDGGVTVKVLPNTVSVRGPNYVGAVLDEAAFLDHHDGAAWSDRDLLQAVQPGMLGVRRPLMMVISTPGMRRGMLAERKMDWDAGKRPAGLMVWHGPTKAMRPNITDEEIAADVELNPSVACEYESEFFSDAGAWLPGWVFEDDAVAALPERRTPAGGRLFAYFDLASGAGADGAALAVAERLGDGRAALIDLWHWPAPFKVEAVIREGAAALGALGVRVVEGDLYGKGLQQAAWRRAGVSYVETAVSASEIYNEVAGPILAGRVDWIRHPVMIAELRGLVETARATPPPRVTHVGGAHDDAANAACGALMRALTTKPPVMIVG